MPTYEYRCSNGHEFERFQKMSDDPVDRCPECGADAERLISAGAGLLFKGSGFYITDYRNSDYQKKASSEGGSSSSKSNDSAKSPEKSSADRSSTTDGKGGSASKGGEANGASDSSASGGGSKTSGGSSKAT